MKANDLRIGNMVYLWNNALEYSEFEINYTAIRQIHQGIEAYTPIPLTEEWLVKFGFEQYNNTNHYFYTNTKFIVKINSEVGYLFGGIDHEPIKYVHQLQNLYFALTNEELTYETTK